MLFYIVDFVVSRCKNIYIYIYMHAYVFFSLS